MHDGKVQDIIVFPHLHILEVSLSFFIFKLSLIIYNVHKSDDERTSNIEYEQNSVIQGTVHCIKLDNLYAPNLEHFFKTKLYDRYVSIN